MSKLQFKGLLNSRLPDLSRVDALPFLLVLRGPPSLSLAFSLVRCDNLILNPVTIITSAAVASSSLHCSQF